MEGTYTISENEILGDSDEKITFTAKKEGDEMVGEWLYMGGVNRSDFTLEKQ